MTGGASFTLTGNPLLFDSDGQLIFGDADGFLSAASPSGVVRQIGRPVIKGYAASRSPDGKWVSSTTGLTGDPCYNCDLLQVLSTATATTWDLTSAGKPLPIVPHEFSPDSSSILLPSRGHDSEGAEDQFEVEAQAPVLDVLEIQPHPIVERDLVPAGRDLPIAGQAWTANRRYCRGSYFTTSEGRASDGGRRCSCPPSGC